ncbi:MAG: hypothetical protein EHM45_12280 [Desulfobacteraceae bacterium]|nr:MAG: hypothetical protein EHM45_12280 [Desulfobacteraceae bacterium]
MFCSKCGSQNEDNAFKCAGCGTIIQVVPPPIVTVKKSNVPMIILIVVLAIPVVAFVAGLIAAIAIPQYNAYRNRAGGSQLILDVKTDKAIENHMARIADELENNLNQKQISFQGLVPKGITGIDITLMRKEDEPVFKDLVQKNYQDFELRSGQIQKDGFAFQLILWDQNKTEIKKSAYEQTLKILENRMYALGVKQTDILPQEETHILIRLSRFKDPQKAIGLIKITGLLEFKLVDEENMIGDWETKIPSG